MLIELIATESVDFYLENYFLQRCFDYRWIFCCDMLFYEHFALTRFTLSSPLTVYRVISLSFG
jgi:hypothetical protein